MDINYPVGPLAFAPAANLPDRNPPDLCIWGDPATQDVRWRDHDPTELVRNLGGLSLFAATGNGVPGPYDAGPNPGAQFIEAGIFLMNQNFDRALTDAGIPHTYDSYGNGTHSWPYWTRDLSNFLPRLQAAWGTALPASFDYESAGAPFSVWDWTFTPHRDVTEMTYLSDVSSSGLDVAGSGVLHVDTAPLYTPGASYAVTGTAAGVAVADTGGRLHFDVDLGPSHVTQQYAFGPAAEAAFTHAHVGISPS
jgi:hypothetical protein